MSDTERLYKRNVGVADTTVMSEGLRSYMLGVYNLMALGIGASAAISYAFVVNPGLLAFFQGPMIWLPFVGILALGWFAPKIIFTSRSVGAAHAAYWAYVAMFGILIGTWVAAFANQGLIGLVTQAFFITSSVFAAMSLYGYTTKKDLSGWGKFLFMASVGLLIAIVVNAFVGSTMVSLVTSGLVVLVFSAVTAYETQMIRNLYTDGAGEMNQRASIFGAFALYGTFATLFIHILNILGIMRD